jgi:ribulose-bisphosphate carboxylase large chain
MSERILATYWVETAYPLLGAVEALAGEQSSGTFVKVPGETPELKERSGARIERLTELDEVGAPSLPGAGAPKGREAGSGPRSRSPGRWTTWGRRCPTCWPRWRATCLS